MLLKPDWWVGFDWKGQGKYQLGAAKLDLLDWFSGWVTEP